MKITFFMALFLSLSAWATTPAGDYLVQVSPQLKYQPLKLFNIVPSGTKVNDLGVNHWIQIQIPPSEIKTFNVNLIKQNKYVSYIQPNYRIFLLEDNPHQSTVWQHQVAQQVYQLLDHSFPWADQPGIDNGDIVGSEAASATRIQDNPPIPTTGSGGSGNDTLYTQQWSMNKIGVMDAWQSKAAVKPIVVAVIDTGVDYTHEDLVDNIWRNPGETGLDAQGRDKSTNGVDDDGNGYIDDVIGWDFASNDNKPFDLTVPVTDLLFGGGNPGHGTHVAGCVAARSKNGKGVIGVGDNAVQIMPIRFITEKGEGTTADAIKAIRYIADNGALVSNNSWGSEGEDPKENAENKALRDAIAYAQAKGSLFIAAAGNGHNGAGYDNDTDPRPGFPASYTDDIIVSVAAIDKNDNLGSFSNWGARSVDIAAPGVAIFSTMVGNKYNDLVIDMFGIKATWDGTSMASPHVAGAAALYWSRNPNKTWQEVKSALLESAQRLPQLTNKVSSGGKLDVRNLLQH